MTFYSRKLDAALALAARAHQGALRKGTPTPYIFHPVHVAIILLKSGAPEHVVLAGVLHDVVEDSDVTGEEVGQQFGQEVARLVMEVTQVAEPGLGWRQKRERALQHLQGVSRDVAWLKAGDALHNINSLINDVEKLGAEAFARFKQSRDDTLWYYGEVARLCSEKLAGMPLSEELRHAMQQLRSLALGPQPGGPAHTA